jgi:Icc-related predicted phosphoesterase
MSRDAEVTLFYAADLHGSDTCFKKWLKAGEFYGADVIVIGGDLTGKVLIPLYEGSTGGVRADWHGREVVLDTGREVEGFRRKARAEGAYTMRTTPDEMGEIRDSIERERRVFTTLKREALEEWMDWADGRLSSSSVRAVVMPGNDDPSELDPILDGARRLENVHGRVVELGPGIWMASRGESTPTPWHTPRELTDQDLGRRVGEVTAELPDGATTIWNLHMPPYETGVDRAPKLDPELNVRYESSGEPMMVPVGSRSIRHLIEERQPTLALHGHIHEGRGRYRIGRTLGFNPGSVYSDETLYGVLARVSARKGVRHYAFTSG